MAEFSLTDLARALDRLSDRKKEEVGRLVEPAATRTRDQVQQAYPVGPTGNLRNRVTLGQPRGFAVTSRGVPIPAVMVRATAPHVHIWQEGTVQRRDHTRGNANRGRSPRHGKVFQAIAAQNRQRMLLEAQTIMNRTEEL